MNYLLFVYYDNTIEDSEIMTNEIALQIADHMTSKEAKFMFGDKHAIFHFSSNLDMENMGGWIDIIHEDIGGFQYFLTPKPRSTASNMPKDNLEHLLSLKKSKTKKTPVTPPKLRTNDIKDGETFFDIADFILNLKKPEVCNLTLDELLDKMVDQGIE
jgi:hypothetical protein